MSQKKRNCSNSTSYLQECNEEKEGIGCPPELWVEEPGKEGEDIIFGCAEVRNSKQGHVWTREQERGRQRKEKQMVSSQNMSSNLYATDNQNA